MMKKQRLKFIGTILFIVLTLGGYLFNRFSYASEEVYFEVNEPINNTVLTIAIIGDSWVADHQLDGFLQVALSNRGVNNKVVSSGFGGARSKLIYQNLFKNKKDSLSSKFIIESNPDYCVVIAGVNDASSQIGKKNYAHHMSLIIETLLYYKIKPIVVSLPEFDVKKTINKKNVLSKTRNILASKINNNGVIDNITNYRNYLEAELIKKQLLDKIILLDFDNICVDYSKCRDLYKDSAHLSNLGNKKLCELIASVIE